MVAVTTSAETQWAVLNAVVKRDINCLSMKGRAKVKSTHILLEIIMKRLFKYGDRA